MQMFLNLSLIAAEPMLLQEYNDLTGIPNTEHFPQFGRKVLHPNGDFNWIPEDLFLLTHREIEGLGFGFALEAAKKGRKITRAGWNGKDMFVVYSPGNKNVHEFWSSALAEHARQMGGSLAVRESLLLKTAQNDVAYWSPSVSDALAEDWIII